MTIHELANRAHAAPLDIAYTIPGVWHHFPPDKCDILLSKDEELLIAIHREDKIFLAERGSFSLSGFVEEDLTAEHSAGLLGNRVS